MYSGFVWDGMLTCAQIKEYSDVSARLRDRRFATDTIVTAKCGINCPILVRMAGHPRILLVENLPLDHGGLIIRSLDRHLHVQFSCGEVRRGG